MPGRSGRKFKKSAAVIASSNVLLMSLERWEKSRRVFAMIESRGKKQGFATRSGAKNETAAQKDDWEDEIFRKQAV